MALPLPAIAPRPAASRSSAVGAPTRRASPIRPEVTPENRTPPPLARPATPRAAPTALVDPDPAPPRPAAHAEPAAATSVDGPRGHSLDALRGELIGCTRCKLSERRKSVVFGEGNPEARVLFIGEAPGANEDRTGRPFVGAAGQLLDAIINNAMGFDRSEVYIANVNKCRPPNNREPQPDEVAACLPFLRQQVQLIRPEVIVCLGRVAAQNLLGRTESATRLRGMELEYEGIPVVVTWHPAYLLREPSRKRETWEDIKRCNRLLGRPEVPPAKA
ncbi:MAG: uracil-DNA glycosylase [Planctomycetes bacterium]|nr:uracil-DNA glycosylase [Planctomycetota bacterium]